MTLTIPQILQLCSFAVFMALGQICFKMAALNGPPIQGVQGVLALAGNPWIWAALALYAVSTLIWVSILQQVPLSIAYPFVALGFVVIPVASYFLFNETLTWQYGAGVLLILVALKLITGTH